jgi:hypothetical protein
LVDEKILGECDQFLDHLRGFDRAILIPPQCLLQSTRLIPENPVHTSNGLHQPVATHRLVNVHRMKAWRVKTRQPHVANDNQLKGTVRITEAIGQCLATRLVADVPLPVGRIGGRAGHHDFDRAARVVQAGRSFTTSR